jgi:hypothetical protein
MLFEDFAKKKFTDYTSLIQPAGGNIYLKQIRNSSLPPFIINFFEHSYPVQHNILTEAEFENTLNRAVIFNINYVIKPKNTLLKFLFGDVETRPADYIRERLGYFLFYNYYIDHIENFIILNSPVTVSANQVEHLINVVNKQIFAEISNPSNGDSRRLNLVKLLYIFFLDLRENNPINIKLPKKILSAFFKDKGFTQIQSRIDKFFSEEIFIQETIELMKPKAQKSKVKASEEEIDEKAKEILSKAKTLLIDTESSNSDIKKALTADETVPAPEEMMSGERTAPVKSLRKEESGSEETSTETKRLEDEIYSEDLILQSQLGKEETPKPLIDREKKEKIFNELFCEVTYRKKILKKIFRRDESFFKEFVYSLIDENNWEDAAKKTEEMFSNKNINYYSDEAVKFVDVMQFYFTKDSESSNNQSSE